MVLAPDLYIPSKGDNEIFAMAAKDPNYFSDYYLKGPNTGTWWLPGAVTDRWSSGYDKLLKVWNLNNQPEAFTFGGNPYKTRWDHEKQETHGSDPAFHHNHGMLFLPYQKALHFNRTSTRTVIGGFGSLGVDSRIFDAATSEYVTIRSLIEADRAPIVLSKTPSGWQRVRASVPYFESREEMFRVRMASGREVCVSATHRFLGTSGYVHTRDLRPGDPLVVPDKLPASVRDGLAYVPSHESASLLQTPGPTAGLWVRHAEPGVPVRWREAGALPVRPAQATEVLRQSGDTTSGYWQGVLASASMDMESMAFYDAERGQIGWRYAVPEPARPGLPSSSLDFPYRDSDKWCYTTLDTVQSVESMGVQDHYDLHVPVHNNYVAEGLIHHNSGKTLGQVVSMLVYGCTLTNFRGFWFAPERKQAEEFLALALQIIQGTVFEKKFLIGYRSSPYPKIEIGHRDVGISTIECYPILRKEASFRTLTGDLAVVDQAEHQQLDLEELLRSIGTRFRGRVSRNGRARVGTITMLANADDNQYLWDIYDRAEEQPNDFYSISPSSYDNPWLTDKDLADFEMRVGNNEDKRRQYMLGERPLGNGQHFSRSILSGVQDPNLDRVMEGGIASGDPDFIHIQQGKIGAVEWLLPPLADHNYLVMSDPGTATPPDRDTGVIMVWDITDFPGTRSKPRPAIMVGFVWVYGGNNIMNWATRYNEMVRRYRAYTTNGFDATGFQAGYDQWLNILEGLFPEKMNFSASSKPLFLNASKVLTANGMMKAPKAVRSMYQQMSKYIYPNEPNNLRQDIVMTFIMSAWWLQRLFYGIADDDAPSYRNYKPSRRPQKRFNAHRR